MKNIKSVILFLLFIPTILLSSCITNEESYSDITKSIYEREQDERISYEEKQLRKKEQDSIDIVIIEEEKKNLRDSIEIIKLYTSNPNTYGGVDLHIVWKNKTKRVIKYANFRVSPINAVGDKVYSEFKHNSIAVVTGPIKPNGVSGYGTYWDCVWYNSTIKKCVINSVELEFMDGSKLEIIM